MPKGFHWKGFTPGPCHFPCGKSLLSSDFQTLSAGGFVTHEGVPEMSILRDRCSCQQSNTSYNLCTFWIFQTKAQSYKSHDKIILATQELIFPEKYMYVRGVIGMNLHYSSSCKACPVNKKPSVSKAWKSGNIQSIWIFI